VRSPISLRFTIAPAKSAMPYTPWLFRIQLEHTPSLNDPKGSRDFYEALGVLVVAWGRLEGHFLACVLAILATPATQGLGKKIPMAWDERKRIWSEAFGLSTSLQPYKAEADAFLLELEQVQDDRNKLIHGLWEPFRYTDPVSADLIVLRHEKGTSNGVSHWRGTISTTTILEVAREADRLNIALQKLSGILSAERGSPAPATYTP
jgi:hypothetical protein